MTLTLTLPGDTPSRPLPLPSPAPSMMAATPAVRRPATGPDGTRAGHPGPVVLAVPGRGLVLVAGIPGAGKSTLLRALPARPGLVVLDSDVQRAALERVLPGVPYPRLRPLVHLLHRLAVVLACCSGTRTVVVHLPASAAGLRGLVRGLARLTARRAYLVWFDVSAEEALAGQHGRGRVIPGRSFARHAAAGRATSAALRSGRFAEGWAAVVVLNRASARRGLLLETRQALTPPSGQ